MFLALVASCDQPSAPVTSRLDVAEVVAGTGDISPDVVERIRTLVATELVPLQAAFDGEQVERFSVHVHGSRDSMPAHLVAGLHQDSPGFAILGRHQIHLIWGEMIRLAAKPAAVVRHELVHELLDQYVQPHGALIPRWFHEGLAQLLAGDTYLGAREEDLVWRVAGGSLPSFHSMEDRFPLAPSDVRLAYAQSFSYVAWLSREYGMSLLLRCARYTDRVTSFGRALVGQTGRNSLQLEAAWKDYVVHGSGAPWRVVFGSWFSFLMVMILPILVLALIRRLNAEERAARQIAARTERDRLAAERAARVRAETAAESEAWQRQSEARLLPESEEGDDTDRLREDGEQHSG
jgi:hypothetical protein